ncbi:TetR/AcrR family transcriptional regulator [Jatrophihabitans lederbergiae]|uniref:Helix-turn-helix domain-containing protein n=1 Tax=Jatrophihabitans lederbergiae TaxID=3075547 RepID=A0ABU2JE51_9ACTN|nr:helix-turn-helix domain-containing protein [Jatrophihabitans sp. DSM 44399]MDT0263262.1 helix-turn-helix domain-containing protein [Jatrophihabitans sp. DSM 44399]
MPETPHPLRKDAALNRERLLTAASELFAERGLNVTLNDIAHHAGVGVGTAYRRFPNKEAVIDALFEERLQAVVAVAEEALDHPDAWQGLVSFLERSLDMQFGDRGLNQIINGPHLGDARIADVRDRIAPLMVKLVERAKAAHAVRPDFDQSDLIFIQLGLSAIMDTTRGIAPNLYRRYLTLILDGIRTDRSEFAPLPTEALSAAQTHRAMTGRRRDGKSATHTAP